MSALIILKVYEKKTQWRIDYSHKKKFDTDLSFNQWYMGWINILAQ